MLQDTCSVVGNRKMDRSLQEIERWERGRGGRKRKREEREARRWTGLWLQGQLRLGGCWQLNPLLDPYFSTLLLPTTEHGQGRGCSCDHRLAKEEDDDVGAQQAETRVFSNDCGGLEVQPQWIDRQATARRDVVRLQERGEEVGDRVKEQAPSPASLASSALFTNPAMEDGTRPSVASQWSPTSGA